MNRMIYLRMGSRNRFTKKDTRPVIKVIFGVRGVKLIITVLPDPCLNFRMPLQIICQAMRDDRTLA